jgi:phthiodiolone/phenolphthiodiolone dimycocerosates ketoreductase
VDVGFALGAPPFASLRRQAAQRAEDGFRGLWWADHLVAFQSRELWATTPIAQYNADPHRFADPFICMAAVAEVSGDALLGVCVTDAIRRMPATLVQTAMTLDHLAPGRVVLGLGAGESANFRPFGWGVPSPAARLDEAARQIRFLLDSAGPDENGAVMGLRPAPGSPGPQFWLAAHGRKGLALTGQYADGWAPHLMSREEWMSGWDTVRNAAVDHGRDPDAITSALSATTVIAETEERAEELLDHPAIKAYALLLPPARYEELGYEHPLGGQGVYHLSASTQGAQVLEAARAVPHELAREQILHGTPESVAAKLQAYEGLDHVVLWEAAALADRDAGRASTAGCAEVARILQTDRPSTTHSRSA